MKASRIALWAVVVVAVVVVAAVIWAIAAGPSEMAPIARPDPASFDKRQVDRGRVLAGYGDCTACHTREDGKPFAGGFPIKSPFGVIYTTNITPDRDTGIGAWSKDAFRRAMKEGVDRQGRHLYPAFPYDHFTKVTDADIDAIYAYLMTVEPVAEKPRENGLGFPFNQRWGLAFWKALYLDKTPWKPDPSKDAEWNNGAYLVEGLGHCGACHTGRNFAGAEKRTTYGGGYAEGWWAPPLNKDSPSQQSWTKNELVVYLMDGWHSKHGMAAGPMTPVVNALHKQNEIDVFAIAAYVLTLRSGAKPPDDAQVRTAAAKLEWGHPESPAVPQDMSEGARVFQKSCVMCHRNNGATIPLALQSSVHAPDASSVAHAIANGITPPTGALGRSMPAFGAQLTEAETVAVVKFVRSRFGKGGTWSGVESAVKDARNGK